MPSMTHALTHTTGYIMRSLALRQPRKLLTTITIPATVASAAAAAVPTAA